MISISRFLLMFGRSSTRSMSLRLLTATMAIVIAVTGFSAIASASDDHPWVGTWSSSPTSRGTWPYCQQNFGNQTLRQIVHTSIGGKQVRVRLSNAFGTEPLEISAAHIAIRSEGAAIKAGSDRELTFGRRRSITIPPGALVLSDPVNLKVSEFEDLAVSIFLRNQTHVETMHAGAWQTNYTSISSGNFTGNLDGTPFEELPIPSWYFLTGVEVKSSPNCKNAIVAFGDSITDGFGSTVDTNNRWPDWLARRLYESQCCMGVLNAGISGNRILHDYLVTDPNNPDFLAINGPSTLSRFDRDVLAQTGVSHVIVLLGANDIGMSVWDPSAAVTAEEIIAGLLQLIERARVRGITVIGGTLLPFGKSNFLGKTYDTDENEQKRQVVNEWIRTSGAFDGVIDFDAAVRNPENPKNLHPDYASTDNLHLNDQGYKAMADAIKLELFEKGCQ